MDPIKLGPTLEPQAAVESRRVDIWRDKYLRKLKDLLRPVVIPAQRHRAIAGFGVAFLISVGLTFTGLHESIRMRQTSGARMSQIEQQIAVRTHNVAIRSRDVSEARAIDNTNMGARDLDRVLADLAWTEAARSPDARLRSWSWTPDQLIAEVNRPSAFAGADRPVHHRAGAGKRGFWTFVISPPNAIRTGATPTPTWKVR